jgi:hypothetical protein
VILTGSETTGTAHLSSIWQIQALNTEPTKSSQADSKMRKANCCFCFLVCSLSLGFSRVVEEAPDTSKWNEVLSQRQENNPSSPVDLFPGLFVRVAGDSTRPTRPRPNQKEEDSLFSSGCFVFVV